LPKSLESLAARRTQIADQFAALTDLRCGSITSTTGRCGKPNCRCHQPKAPGHGPNLRLTYKVQGKTVTESLPNPAAVRKAEREIEEFRKYQALQKEFWRSTRRSARCGPLNRTRNRYREKTLEAIQQEVAREVSCLTRKIFTDRRKNGRIDLEAVEMFVRQSMHRAGAAPCSSSSTKVPPSRPAIPCTCGHLLSTRNFAPNPSSP
jgi:hypothetical protein